MNRLDWNLVQAFTATADAGSLVAAARKLGTTQPTLSRQVAALEAELGLPLFERVGRKLVLTVTGLGLLEHARAMATAADGLKLAAAGQVQDIAGRVCISATDAFSAYVLPDIVARIRELAPHVTIAILATDSISDLRRREADIAIRHVRPTEPELIARLLGEMTADFYASEDWVAAHGVPLSPADLARVDILAFEPIERFIDHLGRWGVPITASQCRIVSESSVVLWEMLRRGLGVGLMLREIAARTPGLVRLLPDQPGVPVPVWLVTHRELNASRRVRFVFDTIAAHLRAQVAGSQPQA